MKKPATTSLLTKMKDRISGGDSKKDEKPSNGKKDKEDTKGRPADKPRKISIKSEIAEVDDEEALEASTVVAKVAPKLLKKKPATTATTTTASTKKAEPVKKTELTFRNLKSPLYFSVFRAESLESGSWKVNIYMGSEGNKKLLRETEVSARPMDVMV